MKTKTIFDPNQLALPRHGSQEEDEAFHESSTLAHLWDSQAILNNHTGLGWD